jgi:hypothetical protein
MEYKRKTWQQKLEDSKKFPKTLALATNFPCYRALRKMGAKPNRVREKEFPTEQERAENFRCYHVTRNDKDGEVNCRMQTKENYDEFWSEVQKDMLGSS